MSVFINLPPKSEELTYGTIALMFAAFAGAVLFAVALSYLFIFVVEIGGHGDPLLGARCHNDSIARFSERPLPYGLAKQ